MTPRHNDETPLWVAVWLCVVACASVSAPVSAADEIPGSELCRGEITRIVFLGNDVTTPEVMLRELALRPGEVCSLDRVVDGVQRLLDLELFRSVRAELVLVLDASNPDFAAALPVDAELEAQVRAQVRAQAGAQARAQARAQKLSFADDPFGKRGGFDRGLHDALPEASPPVNTQEATRPGEPQVELRYIVRERFYFLGVPRLSRTSDGEVRAGLSLQWDNFLGRLHKLKVTSEWRQEDEGRGRGGFVHGLDYDVPLFLESPYGLGVRLRAESREVDLALDNIDYGEGRREAQAVSAYLLRWLTPGGDVQGVRVFFGGGIENRRYTVGSGELGPLTDGVNIDWRIGVENRQIRRHRFRRTGHLYGASLRFSSSTVGSDFDWTRVDAWGVLYQPIGSDLANLNMRVSLGVSDKAPFGERFYAIGGGDLLRGMVKGAREGDVRLLINVEYLDPWYVRPTLRSVLFVDGGNVWRHNDIDVTDLEWRGGVGLRWKLNALSKTDLRFDVAWDSDKGKVVPYLSTSLTF